MTYADRFSVYLDQLEAAGKVSPGDRLPKYTDVAKMFNIPYSSVQRIFKTLERSGRVKIVNGVGTFLNGGDSLPVDFYVTSSTFDLVAFQRLVDEISRKHKLHLSITVKPIHGEFFSDVEEHKVVITESDPWIQMDGCLMDYGHFADYESFSSSFVDLGSRHGMNFQLPFYLFPMQSLIHVPVMRELGLDWQETPDFRGWQELVERCTVHGFHPADITAANDFLWSFPLSDLTLCMMLGRSDQSQALFTPPFYASRLGLEILGMAEQCHAVDNVTLSFVKGRTAMQWCQGSWFVTQCEQKFHMSEKDFKILPIRRNGRHYIPFTAVYLKTFANTSITANERQRVWTFLKALLSKPCQKRVCGLSGALSPRRDMKPSDYSWVTREDHLHYFCGEHSVLVPRHKLSREKQVALSTLYELHRELGFDLRQLGLLLDRSLSKRI